MYVITIPIKPKTGLFAVVGKHLKIAFHLDPAVSAVYHAVGKLNPLQHKLAVSVRRWSSDTPDCCCQRCRATC